jgi:hypothetical protein
MRSSPRFACYNERKFAEMELAGLMSDPSKKNLRMLLIPCSCGATFSVATDYDGKGMELRSFIRCPKCGKRHDPRNRLLTLDYQPERFWKVGAC